MNGHAVKYTQMCVDLFVCVLANNSDKRLLNGDLKKNLNPLL